MPHSRPNVSPPRRARRGSQAVEFALTLPVLVTMLLALVDYGWFFLRQAMVVNTVRESMRFGAMQTPDVGDLPGDCSPCTSGAADAIVTSLATYGIVVDASQVTPTIIAVEGTCALSLTPTIPFDPMTGFVPTPDAFDVNAVSYLPNVTGC